MKNRYFYFLILLPVVGCTPVAKFSYEKVDENAPAQVRFMDGSKGADSLTWKFGDGETASVKNPLHIFSESGNYKVSLTAFKNDKTDTYNEYIQISPPVKCLVTLKTPYGDMLVELFEETPAHRDNFLKLAGDGFYDGLLFHRVIEGFMIQGGDPNSLNASPGIPLGSGGPGYKIGAEITPEYIHTKGAIAAARQGDAVNPEKKSSGSQFYIVHGRPISEDELNKIEEIKGIRYTEEQKKKYLKVGGAPFLDMDYTVFGRVIEGLDILDTIASQPTNRMDRPRDDIPMYINVIK